MLNMIFIARNLCQKENIIIYLSYLDPLLLSNLAPDLGPGVDADGPQDGQTAVHAAALAHCLGVLAGRETRHKVGDDAQAAVVETAK